MMQRIRSRLGFANAMSTGAMFVALSGGAYALSGVPDSGGTFHGCVNRSTAVLRVVKSATSCQKPRGRGRHRTAGEFAVSWNQQGPRGLTGATGVAGPAGAQGPKGDTGPSTGPASGDLTGNYPAPTIAAGAVTPTKLAPPAAWTDISFALPFDCRWQNDPGAIFANAGYYKDALGIVHLRGRAFVQTGGSCFSDSSIADLGFSYAPDKTQEYATLSNNALGRIKVTPDGSISAEAGTNWISLDGIAWRAAAGP